MRKKKKSSGSGFAIFMLIYTVILCAAVALGLRFLWSYMEAYEAAKSNASVEQYKQERLQADFDQNLKAYAESLATPFQSGEEILETVKERLGEVSLRLKKDQSSEPDLPPSYTILMNRQEIGKLYTKAIPLSYGLQGIVLDRTEWTLDGEYADSFQVVAPKEALLTVNGVPLNEQTCTVEAVERSAVTIDSINELTKGYESVDNVLYSFAYYGTPTVLPADNQNTNYVVQLQQNDPQQFFVHAECDAQTAAALKPIAEQFVRDYILFTSNAGSYGIARNHMVPDSPLYARVSGSIDGMRWVAGVTSTIGDLSTDNFVPYGEGIICDAHYKLTDAVGSVMDYNMRIFFVQYLGMWKVYNIQMY